MPEPASSTAIILFADIVDSTALTERMGDASFRSLARRLDGELRSRIREHAGRPIDGKLLGDGVLAVFDSAQRAIDCALRCAAEGGAIGLPLHVGVHAGDVIKESNNVFGGAVNVAARIAAASPPGQVFVSDTVRGLARTSADVHFEDAGAHELKGIGEEVRIFRVRRMGGGGVSLSRAGDRRSGRTWWRLAAVVLGLAALVGGAIGIVLATRGDDAPQHSFAWTTLRAGGQEVRLDVARTAEEQEDIGPSDDDGLVEGEGRLYDGVQASEWQTAGYESAVDIVWVDASKGVIAIAGDVAPDTAADETAGLAVHADARYAIELAAGGASALGLQPGSPLSFFTATTLRMGEQDVNAEVACTLEDQLEIGMIGRPSLDEESALLYDWQRVVDAGSSITTWSTEGYRFAVDIIWLDAAKAVIAVTPDVEPGGSGIPQPESMRYAIEANAGAGARWAVTPGMVVSFDVPC